MFKNFLSDSLNWIEASCSMPTEATSVAQALATLDGYGIRAHNCLPAMDCSNSDLTEALRFLAVRGYVMTDRNGAVIGLPAINRRPEPRNHDELKWQMMVVRSDPAPSRHPVWPAINKEARVSSS